MNKEDVINAGFVSYTGKDAEGRDLFIKSISGLGWSIGIDLKNKECFYFEGSRTTAFPYPVPTKIISRFKYPESVDELNRIYSSIL